MIRTNIYREKEVKNYWNNLIQKDYSICSEFIIKAYKNFKCTEILSKERKRLHGQSKVNKILAGLTLFINIIKLRVFN